MARQATQSVTSRKKQSADELMQADLERSGIDDKDAKRMGCKALSKDETFDLTNGKFHVPSYMIPYADAKGGATGFLRLRFLSEVKVPGESKPRRYWQPPNTPPRVYFPKVGVTKWTQLLKDPAKTLYFTEGEKKASAACKAGIPMLGLGGVWSWRSSKFGKALLDELEVVEWNGREVVVVFDSDLADNPDVQAALTQLGRTLLERGAMVSVVRLTSLPDGSKAGIDDWLLEYGADAFADLMPEVLSESKELWQLNNEVALIRDSGGIVELSTGNVYSKSTFAEIIYANRRFTRVTGDGKLKECSAPDEWLKWPNRREYASLTYAPGDKEVTADNRLNTWRGWGCQPKKGDVKPFIEVFDYITSELTKENKKWFMQWMAYPLQHPGTKLYTSVLLWSRMHGTGKSLLFMMLGKVYGENYTMIGQGDLEGDFNDWAKRKQFVLGEEVTSSERRKDSDRMKFMTTRDRVTINEKYQPKFVLPDVTNYGFTSNHDDAFFVDPRDRRLMIVHAPEEAAETSLYDRADTFYKSPEGQSALFHYLLNVDCAGFNPLSKAPVTDAKLAMIDLSASDLDLFCREVLADPENMLRVLGERSKKCDLYTAEELLELFDPGRQLRTTRIAMAKALRRAGAAALPPTAIPTVGNRQLYAVRNMANWIRAEHYTRADHYVKSVSSLGRAAKAHAEAASKERAKSTKKPSTAKKAPAGKAKAAVKNRRVKR
jgi:hypothetical protein